MLFFLFVFFFIELSRKSKLRCTYCPLSSPAQLYRKIIEKHKIWKRNRYIVGTKKNVEHHMCVRFELIDKWVGKWLKEHGGLVNVCEKTLGRYTIMFLLKSTRWKAKQYEVNMNMARGRGQVLRSSRRSPRTSTSPPAAAAAAAARAGPAAPGTGGRSAGPAAWAAAPAPSAEPSARLQTGRGANNHIILTRMKPRKVHQYVNSSTGYGGSGGQEFENHGKIL